MVSLPKTIGVSSCAFVLCLGLSNVTGAAEESGLSTGVEVTESCTDKNLEREVGRTTCRATQGFGTIKGDVVRVEDDSYLIQGFDSNEVRYRLDSGTERNGSIRRGDRIEAIVRDVNNEKRVLYLRKLEK
jgi:hypothetical protein